MVPSQLLDPAWHFFGICEVEAASVEQELEINFAKAGADNLCFSVEPPDNRLKTRSFIPVDKIHLIQHHQVCALHLVDQQIWNGSGVCTLSSQLRSIPEPLSILIVLQKVHRIHHSHQ